MFQLLVQEGATQSALAKSCLRPVSKSFLHVGDVVVRRQDTSRTRVHVMEPLVGDLRMAQVFDTRNLLPSSINWRGVCSSDVRVEFCQSTVKAALGAAAH